MDTFLHGVCFVPLAGALLEYIVPAILEKLGLTPAAKGDLKDQLLDYLQGKELILVLDNFEHLLEGAGIIADIQKVPSILVITTSRQRLGLQAEWLFEVNGLSCPVSKDTQDLAT